MQISIVSEKLKLTQKYKKKIETKFSNTLEKYLHKIPSEFKKANVTIKKMAHHGYEMKFDMKLPWGEAFANHNAPQLFSGLLKLRDQAKRIIRKELDQVKRRN